MTPEQSALIALSDRVERLERLVFSPASRRDAQIANSRARIIEMYEAGETVEEIAAAVGAVPGKVRAAVQRHYAK